MKNNKYSEIEEILRTEILSGKLCQSLPPERKLAERFGVSYLTVRRAVGNLVEKGLLSREHGRGIFVSTPDREVTRTSGLGFVVPERVLGAMGNISPFYLEIFSGAVFQAQKYGYHLIIESDIEKLVPLGNKGGARKVDAILAVSTDYPEVFHEAAKFVPVVMLGYNYSGGNFPSVFIDDFAGAQKAVNHLIAKGHRRIAHVVENKQNMSFYSRLCGYRKALEDAGIELRPEYEIPNRTGYEEALFALMRGENPPTAVFCANDGSGLHIIKEAPNYGLKVPDDISIVGFDNLFYSALSVPGLTTIAVPKLEIGVRGVDKAVSYLEKNLLPKDFREEIKLELIIRESVKSLGVSK